MLNNDLCNCEMNCCLKGFCQKDQCECGSSCKCENDLKTKLDDDLICEGCADHVCNDNCGCELSEAAKASLKRDLENKNK